MGCSSVKENVVIQIAYCGGTGWSGLAKQICDKIQGQLPRATIDCRPQNIYTGFLEASLIIDKKQRRKVYKGDKAKTNQNIQMIVKDIVGVYEKV